MRIWIRQHIAPVTADAIPATRRSDTMTEERRELGHCDCGEAFTLIRNSKHPTMWKDGRRYVYTNRPDLGACIFRCDGCGEPIHDTF